MAERLPHRAALGFELLAGGAVFLPGFRKLPLAVADLVPPGPAIGEQPTADAPRHPDPPLAVIGDILRDLVIAALRVADRLGYVADIDDAIGVEMWPVVDHEDDIGTRSGLDRRGDASLDVVGIDRFEVELDAEDLFRFRHDLRAQQLI